MRRETKDRDGGLPAPLDLPWFDRGDHLHEDTCVRVYTLHVAVSTSGLGGG